MNSDRRIALAVGLDVFVVIAFVAIGRRNHEESSAIGDVLATGAPFLIGLGLGWLAARVWERPVAIATGLVVWPITVATGMIARRIVFDDGTAIAFVIVATIFLGVFLVGWRAGFGLLERRRTQSSGALTAR